MLPKVSCFILAFLLFASVTAAYPVSPMDDRVAAAFEYLHTCQQDDGGFAEAGRETDPDTSWFVLMAVIAAGEDPNGWKAESGTSLTDYWSSPDNPWIVPDGTAELAKTITAIRALNGDSHQWNGTDYLGELQSRMKPDGHFGDHVYTQYWSILALVAAGEDITKPADWLKKQQNPDGGFPWTICEGTFIDSDADDTAASVMALIASGEDCNSTVLQKAREYLFSQQRNDGGYSYGGSGGSNSASDTWVAQAVVAFGEDPSTWRNSGKSLTGDLLSYQKAGGMFKWTHLMTNNPCRMTAGAIPGLIGKPYPILPNQKFPVFQSTGKDEEEYKTSESEVVTGYPTIQRTASPGERVVTIIDDFGDEVTIYGTPQRIISLAPSNTEMLYAIGLGDRIVGVTDYCNYPPEAEAVNKVGGYSTPNVEKVIANKPDLVVACFGNSKEATEQLRSLGLTVIATNPTDIYGVMDNIVMLGKATGTEEQAEQIVTDMQIRIENVTTKTRNVDNWPTVAHLVWYDPIWVSGGETYQDKLFEMAGAKNAFPDVKNWGIVDMENFILTNPDIIIVNTGTGMGEEGANIIYNWIQEDKRFENLRAVKNNRVYLINSDIINRGSPRLVEALEILAVEIHPEIFKDSESTSMVPVTSSSLTPCVAICSILFMVIFMCKKREW